jgi:hypothetical protein
VKILNKHLRRGTYLDRSSSSKILKEELVKLIIFSNKTAGQGMNVREKEFGKLEINFQNTVTVSTDKRPTYGYKIC